MFCVWQVTSKFFDKCHLLYQPNHAYKPPADLKGSEFGKKTQRYMRDCYQRTHSVISSCASLYFPVCFIRLEHVFLSYSWVAHDTANVPQR